MLQLAIKGHNQSVNLDQSRITIGREGANTVVLEAGDVSGYHAEIHCESGAVFLVDLGSSNGTSVNGKKINQRQKLAAWDRVAFGSVEAEVIDTEGRRPTQMFRAVGQERASAAAGPWRIVGGRGTFEISGRHVVGRDAGCDFTISSNSVSRRHARLEVREGRLMVTDLGSANGTFVNGERVRERVLGVGDEVKFDVESFRVEGPVDPGRTSVRPAAGAAATQMRSAVGAGGTVVVSTPSARLEVVAGMEAKSFALTKAKYQVGRAPGSDIQLPEDSVSSGHAQLERAGGGWRLTDLQSTNGTFVNDQRIDSVELKPGDRVRFGEVRVKFAQDAPQQALRSGTAVMPSRSDTTFVAATRRIPAWGYGVAAFVVVALGVGIFLLRDTLPPTPPADPIDGPLQARRLWTLEVAGGGVVGTPALGKINDDDFLDVVIPERGGFVTAVDGEEGKVIYRQQVPEKIMASVSVGRVTGEGPSDVVVATTGGIVYALGEDGQALWTSDRKLDLGPIVNKPLLADIDRDRLQDVIVPTARKGLVALGGDRGLKLWDTEEMTDGVVVGSPVAADINGDGAVDVVAGTDRGQVLVVSTTGEDVWKLWSVQLPNKILYASPVVVDVGDRKLVVVAAKEIVALDGSSGRVAWRTLAGQSFASSPLAVDGNSDGVEDVLAVTSSGEAYLLSGQHGEDLSSGNVGGEVMATAALFDEDGDGIPEPFLLTKECKFMVLNLSRMRSRLTIEAQGADGCFASPVLGDLDRNRRLDAVIATDAGAVTAFRFNRQTSRGAIVWGEFLGGSR